MQKPISELIAELKNDDVSHHDIVEKELLARGEEAIAFLIDALCFEKNQSCWRIIKALAKCDDPRCIPVLQKIIISTNSIFAQTAVQGLERYGTRGIEPLLQVLTGEATMEQTYVIAALGRIGDKRVVQSLIECLMQTSWSVMRYVTIEALGLIGDKRAIDVIRQFENDENHHVRDYTKLALKQLNSIE